MTWLIALDLVLVLGLTLRLSRLIVTDDLGRWWIKDPLDRLAHKKDGQVRVWHKYLSGLECLYCVGFWVGVGVITSLMLTGGPGGASIWWRLVAGTFALNWIAAHIGVRMGDAGYADE